MNTQPYIGVTGIAEPSQAKQLLEKMTSLYGASQLMCGVILSNSRIQGQETDHPNRHPDIETIPSIFPTHERCLNLIHYCPPDSPMIDQLLQRALEAGGTNCHGVQINTPKNVAWTPVAPVEKFSKRNPNTVIILQITRAAVEELLCNPERIAEQCRLYQEATSRFIIDLSAGNAIPINVELSAKIANAIQERMPEASITFAGGLSPQNVARISREIRAQHANPFSIDAEGALRTSEDHLNMRAAGLYISQAITQFIQAKAELTVNHAMGVISFDIDLTLRTGDDHEDNTILIDPEKISELQRIGYIVGTCSDREPSDQRQTLNALGQQPHFCIPKEMLTWARDLIPAETHLHIGDDDRRDREIALRSGWEHQWPDQFQQP